MSLVPRNGRVAVVGAGISGLSFSYFLLKIRPDVHITIHEAASEPGGWIQTTKLNDSGTPILLEKGPRTLRGVSDGTLLIVDMMKQLKLENEVEVMKASSVGNRKWLLDPANKLVQVPSSLLLHLKFFTNEVSDGIVPGVVGEAFRKPKVGKDDESIRSFIERRFGSPQVADNMISAIMHGIYSGDVAKLSVQATMPSLAKVEAEHGSIVKGMMASLRKEKQKEENVALKQYEKLISPSANIAQVSLELKKYPIMRLHSGLQTLPLALAKHLSSLDNVKIHYNLPVESLDLWKPSLSAGGEISSYDSIRFTLGFESLRRVAHIKDLAINAVLDLISYSTIFLANVYAKKGGLIPKGCNGFGFLVPKRNPNPESLLGVIFDSDTELDAQRFVDGQLLEKTSYDKITLMIGGHYFSSRGVPSAKASLRSTRRVLSEILGVPLDKYNVVVRDEASEGTRDVTLADNDLLISYNLHEKCIPQYNVGYLGDVAQVEAYVAAQSLGKVTLGGPSVGKLGVPDNVMSGLEAALALCGPE